MHCNPTFINDFGGSQIRLTNCFPSLQARNQGGIMHTKEYYLDQVVNEVENLSSRVALLKTNFSLQTPTAKLEHYWELEHVRSCFKEFKARVGDLQDADDLHLEDSHDVVEVAWNDLVQAVDVLLGALPGLTSTNYVV
jgi:hypothetical protein